MSTNNNTSNQDEEKPPSIWWLIIAIGIVIAIWLSSLLFTTNWIYDYLDCKYFETFLSKENSALAGVFGDMFGGVNALFSALAFAVLIYTLLCQRKELNLQRQELRHTRQVLNDQKDEFKEQNITLKQQRFENTFFNMLSLQQEIINNLHYSHVWNNDVVNYSGRLVFKAYYDYLKLEDMVIRQGIPAYENAPSIHIFDHYFMHLYRIIKFTDASLLIDSSDQKYEYISIIRAQLSNYEMQLLLFNGLTRYGSKFKTLIEKYALFENCRVRKEIQEYANQYEKSAFNR